MKFTADKLDRLDKFLASKIDVSRGQIQRAIKDGKVFVDGKVVSKADFKLSLGNEIELPEFEPEQLKPTDLKLKIVFENQELAVIDKPAGMVVHPGAGNKEGTLVHALLARFPGIERVGEPHRPGIVHRLDEDTSGLILVAKTSVGFDYLKKVFLERNIDKRYIALVHGVPVKLHGIIDLPLEKDPSRQKMKVGSGKEAVTEYKVLKSLDHYTLLEVKLHTGRTHQIRAHLSHLGHPIVGDTIYGSEFKEDRKLIDRQFLHAYLLKLKLSDGTTLELISELPDDLNQVLNKLGIIYDNNI